MINFIKNIIWKPEGFENLKTPKDKEAIFQLVYNNLLVGVLQLKEGKWYFKYTDEFKKQNEISPIVDFPDLIKQYESDELWPFFASRIPSLNQPAVQKVIQQEKINGNDIVGLLKFFGQFTITNPFKLVST